MRTTRKTRRMLFVALAAAGASFATTPDYTLPTFTYPTREEVRLRVRRDAMWLMRRTNVPDGDATLVCTDWLCPTSIVVGATRYAVATNRLGRGLSYEIWTTDEPTNKVAHGRISPRENGREARLYAFESMSQTSMPLSDYARGVRVLPHDPATNALWLTRVYSAPDIWQDFVYKNLYLCHTVPDAALTSAATNVLPFMVELINAGLPEGSPDRIVLP